MDDGSFMNFRLKAFAWHFGSSACLLTLVIGGLYLGWYRWPGWYSAGMLLVLPITVAVDVAIGPLLTFIVANPNKPRRELARDISIIAAVQLIALSYGTIVLWHGRPLYYAFSVNQLEVVQAMEIPPEEITLGEQRNPELTPHWYSLPRWIYAPLPDDTNKSQAIVNSAIGGGTDVTGMPSYYQPWTKGLPELRRTLQKVDDSKFFSGKEKEFLKLQMQALGFAPDAATTIPFTGRGRPLLAVFDVNTMQLKALLLPHA
jgi:hypothetical protein